MGNKTITFFRVSLFLASYLAIYTCSYANEDYRQLGCRFINDKYHMQKEVLDIPVWGMESIDSADFDDEAEFKIFFKEIEIEHKHILETELVNNVNDLLELKSQFDEANGKWLVTENKYKSKYVKRNQFDFDKYRPEILGPNGNIGTALNLQLMETLAHTYLKYKSSMYLGAASVYTEKQILLKISKDDPSNENPEENHFRRYVGVMKIKINCRTGYVIFNPGGGVPSPVVVMADKEHPHRGIFRHNSYDYEGNWISYEYKMLTEISSYIYTVPAINDNNSHGYLKIFIGKPYCSILDTTHKYLLRDNLRYIKKRNGNGQLMAEFSMKLFPTTSDKKNLKKSWFLLGYVHPVTGDQIIDKISVSRFISDRLYETERALFRNVDEALNGTLSSILVQFYNDVYFNLDFRQYLYANVVHKVKLNHKCICDRSVNCFLFRQ